MQDRNDKKVARVKTLDRIRENGNRATITMAFPSPKSGGKPKD